MTSDACDVCDASVHASVVSKGNDHLDEKVSRSKRNDGDDELDVDFRHDMLKLEDATSIGQTGNGKSAEKKGEEGERGDREDVKQEKKVVVRQGEVTRRLNRFAFEGLASSDKTQVKKGLKVWEEKISKENQMRAEKSDQTTK